MNFACMYLSKMPGAIPSSYESKIGYISSPKHAIVSNAVIPSFNRLNGMCHAFQLGGCECCMHQHTTAQCEPGDCLLLCWSHHCTQHRVCTACWYISRHSLVCASSAVRQIQCTNKTLRLRLALTSKRASFLMCATLPSKGLIAIVPKLDASYV